MTEKLKGAIAQAAKFGESASFDKMFSPDMIDTMNKYMSTPEGKKRYLLARKRYEKLAQEARNPIEALYYEYRMYMSKDAAMNLARNFYSRAGDYPGIELNLGSEIDDEDISSVNLDSVIDLNLDKGMFVTGNLQVDTEKEYELVDLLKKLYAKVGHDGAIVLSTYLLIGSGPGMRVRASSDATINAIGANSKRAMQQTGSGLDVEELLGNDTPKEWFEVSDKVEEILKAGIHTVSASHVYSGVKAEDTNNGQPIKGLISSTVKIGPAQKEVQAAMKAISGYSTVEDAIKWVLSESKQSAGKALKEAATNRDGLKALGDYLQGKKVSAKDLLSVIVNGVALNMRAKTYLAQKSPIFGGSVKDAARYYFDLAKTNKPYNAARVQAMLLAPMFDKMVRKKV